MVRVLSISPKIIDCITVEGWLASEPEIKEGLVRIG